ncbi:MAG: N(4)-(beta-N-acetylglucosaminyl)-L-asparaginase [Bacteroidetes bacterium]|nr:N(4)-(beta-N-acetylglucosaminyl)-L-asparaginase [Bacteroidota bacterium]MCW5894922.1 N(4)-(beta-N-acetylglucosaminyl)-L-asparaginase [Bacteroidota bacterium]
MSTTRREFLKRASAAGVGALAVSAIPESIISQTQSAVKPVAISSGNGIPAVTKAIEMIRSGSDALDAVIAGVNIVENDPNDTSVGYGGLPNEEGVVELDAAVMHGPTHRAGAVASIRNIKNPSKVARLVMERTDHVLIVGEGALRFARAHGFVEENLLTDRARQEWLKWKENLSTKDDWLPPHTPDDKDIGSLFEPFFRNTGTIHCGAIDLKGNISCVTTTSGLAYKIPGRVGDSPIIGAGLYCDNDVGSAGSTGRGEANLINCSSVMVVEFMRQGKSPEQACLDVCKRITEHNKMRRLKRDDGKPDFNVNFYAINKKGEFGGAAIWQGPEFAFHDGTSAKLLDCAYLYKK